MTNATPTPSSPDSLVAFLGGGNMATAIIGGMLRQGHAPGRILVVDPGEAARQTHAAAGLQVAAGPDERLKQAAVVVWAVKPQQFKEAAASYAPLTTQALHYSVMAGLRTNDMARQLGTARIVRAMPNTPALVAQGMTGLYARPEVTDGERAGIEALVAPTGQWLWVDREADLDAVTALSGSGPAYVFYFIETMMQAGVDLGLDEVQARHLAQATFAGATALASQSADSPAVLRGKVTSKGGTTFEAIAHLDAHDVKRHFIDAMKACHRRASELGDEFGR